MQGTAQNLRGKGKVRGNEREKVNVLIVGRRDIMQGIAQNPRERAKAVGERDMGNTGKGHGTNTM